MSIIQVVLYKDALAVFVNQRFWSHIFLAPAYVALSLLVVQAFRTYRPFQRVRACLRPNDALNQSTQASDTRDFFDEAKQHIQSQGVLVMSLKVSRLLGTITMVALTAASLMLSEDDQISVARKWGKKHKGKHPNGEAVFTDDDWIEVVHLALYSYASLIALVALFSNRRWSSTASAHLTIIMLTVVAVYTYRDLYPLITFTLVPLDAYQGWLLWSRIGVACFMAVFIPLITPRTYDPIDPLNPAKEVNPEQTASLLSFVTFTFMDPMIWMASRTSHLPYDQLPPLADYDRAAHLVNKSEQILDPFLRQKRTHLFWGLLHFFTSEYVRLALMLILRSFAGFMAPVGMNRVLLYLETRGENAVVRPWVWVLWLFLGPLVASALLQYYIYLATRTLVRIEGILTQLVFDHALRIRMKEETEPGSTSTTAATTPETRSIAEGEGESIDSEGETQNGSGTSTAASTQAVGKSKGKGKAKPSKPPGPIPPAGPGPDGAKAPEGARAANLIGKINNFVTTDLGNITDGRDFLFVALYGPLQLIIGVWFLYTILGWSALVGMVVMVVSVPLPGYIAKIINDVQAERMKKTDARVQKVTETLSVIRMTKLFGWEGKVNEQIAETRETELKWLKKRQLWNLLNGNLNFFLPLLTMLATFASYTTLQGEELSASKVFSCMAVFDMMRNVVHGTFFLVPMMINAKVSLDRINEFLLGSELLDRFTRKGTDVVPANDPAHYIDSKSVGFRDATFTWSGTPRAGDATPSRRRFQLSIEGELFFQPHRLNLVIGPTGSGKTSLLMALLGEMHYEPNGETAGFRLPRQGGVAYAAQEAWVQSETIKENILFGKPYDQERYDKVIFQCGLERDLSLFEGGDATEVGEKGLTLSGGQKARITLARAVYSDAEILLLDDILAALDVHTARFVVDECLQGDLLQGRTTILVTHNVTMVAPIANFVVSLGLDGRVKSKGTVSDALTKDQTLLQEVSKMSEVVEKAEETVDVTPENTDKQAAAKLVAPEEIELGHIGIPALKLYLSNLGGFGFWITFLVSILLAELLIPLSTWFLGYWASQYDGERPGWAVPVLFYLSVYAVLLLAMTLMYSVALGLFVFGSIKASRTIHRKLIESILGTTLRWLDTIPTARIIARCTQDIRAVDGPINQYLGDVIEITLALLCKFAAVILFVPIFVLPGALVFVVGWLCGQVYIKAQLSVKREMSNRRSPVLAHFGAAITGLTSIRAYGAQDAFRNESMKRIDGYTRPARTYYNCNRWISLRIDAIGGLFAASLAVYLVYGNELRTVSNTGFSLTMAVGFSELILWWVRILNEFEVQGNSLERIQGYMQIDQEPKATQTGKPPAYWPASGALSVESLCARYSTDGPKVLHDISFKIKSGERVGVVGRTGSGKSSLTLSLLRCIPTEGRITFDGLPTDSINLDALRSSITIIPQQPELLSGTLRENLDPFSEHSDATLNDALRSAGLFNLQAENDDASNITLDSSISSGGGNLSVGQRQILALARAIVRQSKLLILDEATSAIDYATDTIIQNTLRDVLKDATLITVAHRLQTIMDADKIMVLDAGKMVEFDSPSNLLKQEDGYLRSLVDESGDRDALYKMAEKAGRND